MSLESATYISQLNPANPISTDPLQQGYNHLNLIKQVLQDQFPNLGTTAVSATSAGLNSAAAGYSNPGVLEVLNNGTVQGGEVQLDGVGTPQTGTIVPGGLVQILNSGTVGGAGSLHIGMATAGTLVGTVYTAGTVTPVLDLTVASNSGTLTLDGTVSAVSAAKILQGGVSLVPPGIVAIWYGSVATIPSGWSLCNGATVNGFTTPNLTNLFVLGAGNSYVPGQTGGASSSTVQTDQQGAHSHTGATGSAGSASLSGTTDTQGSHSHGGATGGYTLQIGDIPPHTHEQFVPQGSGSVAGPSLPFPNCNPTDWGFATGSTGGGNAHSHTIAADGLHSHNLIISPVPAHQHAISTDGLHLHNVTVSTLPPFYALCYVMKTS